MKTSADPRARRRLVALAATALVVFAVVGVGSYGLLTGPHSDDTTVSEPATEPPRSSTTPSPSASSPATVPPITPSRDPETFARAVATALFTWDTGSGLMPLDYTAAILTVGDPTGSEQAGLASDIAAYLPTRDAWIDLRRYDTTQTLTITSIEVPAAWDEAVAQAQPGQLPDGAVAYTIHGTRHREGVWDDQPVTSEQDVAFTVFIACPPDDPCHVLRLSQLDNPLN